MIFNKKTVEDLVHDGIIEKPIDGNHGEKHPTSKDYVKDGIPFVMVSDISDGSINFDNCKFISQETRNGLDKGFSKPGDVLLSHKATIGLTCIVGEEYNEIVLTPQLTYYRILNDSILNKYYLKYYFDSYYFQSILNDWAKSGSTRPYLGITAQLKLPIVYPDIIIQNKIFKILGDIDEKIKLNNQTNNNLLELINLNYTNYINSLNNYDELDIIDIFDFETGVEPGSSNYLSIQNNNSVKFYRVRDMNGECNTYVDLDKINDKLLSRNDVVISFDATIGRIGYGLEGAYSSGIKRVSVKEKYKNIIGNSLVFAYFNSKEIQDIMHQNSRGTTIMHASSSISFMKFKYNEAELLKLNDIIGKLFKKMIDIKMENQTLGQLRDTLLPSLMNGEIDLDNIEI